MVRIAICFTAGILLAYYSEIFYNELLFIVGGLFLLLFIGYFISRRSLKRHPLFAIITYIAFICLGYYNYQSRQPSQIDHHYTHLESSTDAQIQLKITDKLKPDLYNDKYVATVHQLDKATTRGNVLLLIAQDSSTNALEIDQTLLISSTIAPINPPLNPAQFDYAHYMKTQDVYGQIKIKNNQIILVNNGTPTITGIAEQIRSYVILQLKKTALEKEERAIIQALVLGQKNEISKKTLDAYAAAGAIHILAVSGLHVGVLFIMLQWCFGFVKRIRYGQQLHSVLIICCLWSFAFITGLSPSVTRAVTMFTCILFVGLVNRRTNTLNSLFISYFLLLLYNPNWLFAVGFQLSYLAVFFIVWIQPEFTKLYNPRNKIKRTLYQIATVSIAAQLGVMPLSLYYFHQLPGLFLITNMVLLPFLAIILNAGIIVTILAALQLLPDFVAIAYGYVIKGMNSFIEGISSMDAFLIKDISFSGYKVIASYLVVVALVLFWKNRTFKRLSLSLISILCLIAVYVFDSHQANQERFIVFQKSRHTLLGVQSANQLKILKSDTLSAIDNYPIKNFKSKYNLSKISEASVPSYFVYNDRKVIVVDSMGVYPTDINDAVILLTHSPKVNLERLIDSIQPHQIIADGSNYHSYVERWRKTCNIKKLPFHHTGTKGAFVID